MRHATMSTSALPADLSTRTADLHERVAELLAYARQCGATAAEAVVGSGTGLELNVRLGDIDTVEHIRDHSLGITVYVGQCKGSASTSDFSSAAIRDAVQHAVTIAKYTQPDCCAGLADAGLMATAVPDLDLYHPWELDVEHATALALSCEQAAREVSSRIVNSEGASFSAHSSLAVYGNSHGFIGGYPGTRYGLSCTVVGQDQPAAGMQRDHWWSSARALGDLAAPADIGRRAAERTLARLGACGLTTRTAPVLFSAELATGLLGSFIGAIKGGAQYRKSSFLLDRLGSQLFPSWVQIDEQPLLPRGLASTPFDGDGVATYAKAFVQDGVLSSYVLGNYSACRLGLQTTANAGGVHNLRVNMGQLDRAALLRELDTGLFVTKLMGRGVNMMTGDYSRGAAGFWVEKGQIAYPVEEITIAGNLTNMFANLVAIGNDCDFDGSTRTGSWLIEQMTIAGGEAVDSA